MRVFVTGSGGFVGCHLVARLQAIGHQVTATDREVDVSDASALEPAVRRAAPALIVHLAAISSVPESRNEPDLTYRVNFLGTRCLLETAQREAPDARILLIGSADTYGSSEPGAKAFAEDAPLRPGSPYARTKAAADLLGAEYAAKGLDVVRARPFNHAGPGQSDAFVLSSFARQAALIALSQIQPQLRVGNLDSVRDFLDVDDVIDAYLALSDPKVPSDVYNVASGRGVRIGDALDEILAIAGVKPEIEIDPERFRPTDHAVGNADRLRSATGWKPRTPLSRTLERLVQDWRERLSAT